MAERVNQRGMNIAAQLARVPNAVWFALLVVGGIVVAAIVQFAGGGSGPQVSGELVSLPAGATASRLPVEYRVSGPENEAVRCRIDAIGKDHGVVGTTTDTVLPHAAGRGRTGRTIVVSTTKLAVSADINSCAVVQAS